MTPSPSAIRDALRAALTRGEDHASARFASPLVTAIVVDAAAGPLETLVPLLLGVVATLETAGVPRGRQFVLFVHADGSRPAGDAQAWRAALGMPVLFHDPEGTTFVVERAPIPVELDDELREAEAILTVGPAEGTPGHLEGGPLLLCPGAVGARTAAAWQRLRESAGLASALELSLMIERLAPVDLAVTWDAQGRVTVAPGAERFAALARAAGGG